MHRLTTHVATSPRFNVLAHRLTWNSSMVIHVPTLAGVGEMRVNRSRACSPHLRPRLTVHGSPRPQLCLAGSPEQPDQLGSTFCRARSADKAPCSSRNDRVSRCQVTHRMNTPAPSQAAWQGSRPHHCATPGSQQQRRAFISRSACSTAPTSAHALSGGMTCRADTDGVRTTSDAG